MRTNPRFEVNFRRDYGIHSIETPGEDIHIFSHHTWEDLRAALRDHLPMNGTVLTTEQATFTNHQAEIPDNRQVIADRIAEVRELTHGSDATLLLGTPLEETDGNWSNTVMHMRRGEIIQVDRKIRMSGYEQKADIITPAPRNSRQLAGEKLVLICSEVIAPYVVVPPDASPQTALISACWAVPDPFSTAAERDRWMQAYDSVDAYYEKTVQYIGQMVFRGIPSLKTIVMVDRNVTGSECAGPYNAVFTRLAG